MSYGEKKTIVSMVTGLLIMAAYCVYVIGKRQSSLIDPVDLQFWAGTMLVFIGAGVAAMVIIHIVFHILIAISIAARETVAQGKNMNAKAIDRTINAHFVEDEMDKLIDMKSSRLGFMIVGLGFITGLVTLVMGLPPAVMLNIVFGSCYLSSLAGGILSIIYYRKGITNG
jgi:hypothetical protein